MALFKAAHTGWPPDGVALLLAQGADTEERGGRFQDTPLIGAAQRGYLDTVKQLLAAGASVDAQNDMGGTALHYAARDGREELVALLLEAGAQVDLADSRGYTPLMCASEEGRPRVVRQLLRGGADPRARNLKGQRALHCALMYESFSFHKAAAEMLVLAERARDHVSDQGLQQACAHNILRVTLWSRLADLPIPPSLIRFLESVTNNLPDPDQKLRKELLKSRSVTLFTGGVIRSEKLEVPKHHKTVLPSICWEKDDWQDDPSVNFSCIII